MSPLPKRKFSRSRTHQGRAHMAVKAPAIEICKNCGKVKRPHFMCEYCKSTGKK